VFRSKKNKQSEKKEKQKLKVFNLICSNLDTLEPDEK
jgi:hypothetical protein